MSAKGVKDSPIANKQESTEGEDNRDQACQLGQP